MTKIAGSAIPRAIHDAAGEWVVRRQGEPDPRVERAFATWIEADRRHRIAYEQAKRGWEDSLRLADSEIGRTRKLRRAPLLMRHSTHVAAASFCVVVVLGVGTIGLVRHGVPFQLVSPAEAATYQTSVGEIRTIRLSDGSEVTLDTATRVRVSMTPGERKVSLEKGRARFHAVADSKRPFTVTVHGGEVVARSTLFDVSVFSGRPVVTALEGSVELNGTAQGASFPSRTLAAGQSLVLDNISDPRPIPADEARWVSGMLALDGTPLAEAVAALNRYNRIQVRLGGPRLANLSVTGAFGARDPEGFARAVAATFALAIDRSDPGVMLLRPDGRATAAPR
jgi:transmembrane sensor